MMTHRVDATAVLVQEQSITPELVKGLNVLEASLSYIDFEMNRDIHLRGYHYPQWRRSFVLSAFGRRPAGRRYSK